MEHGNNMSVSRDVVVVDDDHEGPLPGFRFHPTDEELVAFYLKRKVEKRPLSIEIIKQIDIYKHDPWDLAKISSSVGDKEWYFYCKRGRKYRNSIRPNRVTISGFWKATGIDRPIYSNGGQGHHCIGLKKSLVYYRGSAGKGTKTDWMMHEFRLPTTEQQQHRTNSSSMKDISQQEAEIWTLCRIFKRNKRHTLDWRHISAKKNANASSKLNSITSDPNLQEQYISFATGTHIPSNVTAVAQLNATNVEVVNNQQRQQQWGAVVQTTSSTSTYSSPLNQMIADDDNDSQSFGLYDHNWDDLCSVVEFALL